MAYSRVVKTGAGSRAVQIVWSNRGGKREIEHLGSAHDDVGVELLRSVGHQRILGGQGQFDFGEQDQAAKDPTYSILRFPSTLPQEI